MFFSKKSPFSLDLGQGSNNEPVTEDIIIKALHAIAPDQPDPYLILDHQGNNGGNDNYLQTFREASGFLIECRIYAPDGSFSHFRTKSTASQEELVDLTSVEFAFRAFFQSPDRLPVFPADHQVIWTDITEEFTSS